MFEQPYLFKLNAGGIDVFEQAQSVSKQNRHDPAVQFRTQSGVQALLVDACSDQKDVFISGGCFRFRHGVFDSIGHESNGQAIQWM
jgi:hypothetical protein